MNGVGLNAQSLNFRLQTLGRSYKMKGEAKVELQRILDSDIVQSLLQLYKEDETPMKQSLVSEIQTLITTLESHDGTLNIVEQPEVTTPKFRTEVSK